MAVKIHLFTWMYEKHSLCRSLTPLRACLAGGNKSGWTGRDPEQSSPGAFAAIQQKNDERSSVYW